MGEHPQGQVYCVKCKTHKNDSEFSPSKVWGNHERRGHCRDCHRKDMADRRKHSVPVYDSTPEASIPDGYEDEMHFIAFCTPSEYLSYIKRITENAGERYAYREKQRGRKPQGLT
jgi:hypothetical protein